MASKTTSEHKKKSPKKVSVAVVTISDSKFTYQWTGEKGIETEDLSGKEIIKTLEKEGHEITFYCIVPDHAGMIIETLDHVLLTYSPDAVITTGGTGIGPRDVTIEAVEPSLEKVIEGFGELFRQKSIEEVGNAAMLSRALAGVASEAVIFCLPGSPNAVKTGLKLIVEEIRHLVKHTRE